MITTNFLVKKRKISQIDSIPYTGEDNIDTFKFEFDEEWDGLDKTLVIVAGSHRYNIALLHDECVVPFEFYQIKGNVLIGLFGTDGTYQTLATGWLPIYVEEDSYEVGVEPDNLPSQTQWDAFVTEINNLLEQAEASEEHCAEILAQMQEDYETYLENLNQIKDDTEELKNQTETIKDDTNQIKTDVQGLKRQIEQEIAGAELKISEYNANATQKTNAFNQNATDKTNAYNSNATQKTSDYNSNASSKITAFDDNATSKTNAYNDNAAQKTTDYNDNATAKTTAFNENAEEKTADFDEHTEEIQKQLDLIISNYNTDTATGSNLDITDALNGYNQGIAVGGQVTQDGTPTPDSPVDIVDVTGTQEIVVSNKNSLTGEYEHLGFWNTTVGQNTSQFNTNSSMLGIKSKVIPGATYTLSRDKITNRFSIAALEEITSTNGLVLATNNSAHNITITIPIGYTAIAIYLSNNGESSEGINLQLEEGTTATSYVPHKGLSTTLHLGDIHLRKIGNYQDKLYKENDKWWLSNIVKEKILNGTENITLMNDKVHTFLVPLNATSVTGISSHYKKIASSKYDIDTGIYLTSSIFTVISDLRFSTVKDFKAWLTTNNVVVDYVKSGSPTITEITSQNYPELYADLQELDKIQTYREYTIIQVTSETGNPAQLEVTYLKDDRISKEDFELLKARVDLLEE